jgi:small-conductance mechanosensitive channel
MNLEGKWNAILIGGLITGLAPLVPFVNLACCLIPFAGAIVAVAIYSNSSPPPVLSNNDGVVLGAMSGVVGTLLYAILVVPLVFILGGTIGRILGQTIPDIADIPASVRPLLQSLSTNFGSVVAFVVIFRILSQLGLSLVFGILGGIVGIALFRRKTAA